MRVTTLSRAVSSAVLFTPATKAFWPIVGARIHVAVAGFGRPHLSIVLAANRAMTFMPQEDGFLRVNEGRLWITMEAPLRGPAPRNGDHFVDAGAHFDVHAGECAVLEAIRVARADAGARFDCQPAPVRGNAHLWRRR